VISLGPNQLLSQIVALVPLPQILAGTTISFSPRGIQVALLQIAFVEQTGQLRYTGILTIASDAAAGLRDMTVSISQALGVPIELTCSRAFTVEGGGGGASFFNGPPTFTLPMESASEPSCGCRTEPTYSHGIGQVDTPEACGIKSDGVNRSVGTGAQAFGIKEDGVNRGIRQDAGFATVFLHNGEFNHYVVDLEIPGRGFNWKFERKYRSGVMSDGPLGANWEFNYNRRLFVEANGAVTRMDGYGRGDRYEPGPGGSFTSPNGFYTRLVRNGDGTYTERDRSGTTVTYARPNSNGLAFMTSLADRDGNTMRFTYNTRGQLTQVLDTLGRPITYQYNNQGRLTEVRDFFNRSLRFQYDNNGDLVAVTSPAVTGTPNGNDFPQGKTERYAYLSGSNLNARLQHNLISITAPNEAASGGPPRLRIEYETNTRSPNFERVLSQTIGGTNQTGVPAGGTVRYQYQSLGMAPANDFLTPVSQTTVTDRNGNLTEYQFNQLGNIVRTREFANRNIRPDDPEFFETRHEYNQDGEVLRIISPEGNATEYVYDRQNPDRFQQGNILQEVRRPDAGRGGDQEMIVTSYTYEPVYNQVRSVTEARGNDPGYAPPNGGPASAARYTTTYTFDYQEGDNLAALAARTGLTQNNLASLLQAAGVSLNLPDLNGDGVTNQISGKVIRRQAPTVQLLPGSNQATVEGSTQQPIQELYTYNQAGQIVRKTDPEGNVEVYEYHPENDPDGDGMNLTPNVSTDPLGYLRSITSDALSAAERNSRTNPPPAQIRRRFFYDRVGNVIREIDGRGIATDYAVNQLNQVVRTTRAADVGQALSNPEEPRWGGCTDQSLPECSRGLTAFRYLTNLFYDANNNVVKREVENRDSNNQALAGPFVEVAMAYDILDHLIELSEEISETPMLDRVTRYRYDRNENRVLEISPLAVAGQQASNVVSSVFDERDLLFTATRGGLTDQFMGLEAHADIPELSQITDSRDISTFTQVYDGNRNLTMVIDSADNTGDGQPEATITLYDGFDRAVSVVDAVGNQSFTNYDPAGNVVRVSRFGPVGGPSPRNNSAATFTQPLTLQSFRQPLLSQAEYKYDELSRVFEQSDMLFDYRASGGTYARPPVLTDGPLGAANDGRVVTRREYDRNSRTTFVIEDDGDTGRTFYDGVGRVIRQVDPEQNESLMTYDDNSNVVRVVEIDVTQPADVQAGRVPNLRETFTTINVYDSLNRLIRTTDNLGQTTRTHYDSRNNLIFTSDAQHSANSADLIADPLGLAATRINRAGNTMEFFFDGINRKLADVRVLRVDGQGRNPIDTSNPANPDGLIVIDYEWDLNSRLVARADDGSMPGDQNTSIGVIEPTNAKGNVTVYLYDDLNRMVQEIMDDGTMNVAEYDADGNRIRGVDGNGNVVRKTYDGINRLIREDITRATSSAPHPANGFKDPTVIWSVTGTTIQQVEYDGLSRLTRAFDNNDPDDPGDDAIVTAAYDSLSRKLEEVQNGLAVSSRFAGDNNRVGLVYPNGRAISVTFDHLDRIDQITHHASRITDYDYIGPSRILERSYPNGVRLTYLDNARQQAVGYDGVRRPIQHRHLRANNSLVAGFTNEFDRADNRVSEVKQHLGNLREDYAYDSGYRLGRFARQGEQPDTWQIDGANNWANRKGVTNQANNMNEYVSFAGVTQPCDDNGNMVDEGVNRYEYDFANRLRRVVRKADNAVIAVYRYDAFGRRTERIVTNAGALDDRVRYLYDGWREIEERRAGATQQYVYGGWIDEPLTLDRDDNNDGVVDRTFFYHQDAKTYVVALTDATGAVVDQVMYDAYGRPSSEVSPVGNPYLFTGRRYDPETGFYYYRTRYYDPLAGRFITRDTIGMWGDKVELGNGYSYVGNDPVAGIDPMGTFEFVLLKSDKNTLTPITDVPDPPL
jgi:RHS repeat-associated protein